MPAPLPERHQFTGRNDRYCTSYVIRNGVQEVCNLPDRDPIHYTNRIRLDCAMQCGGHFIEASLLTTRHSTHDRLSIDIVDDSGAESGNIVIDRATAMMLARWLHDSGTRMTNE